MVRDNTCLSDVESVIKDEWGAGSGVVLDCGQKEGQIIIARFCKKQERTVSDGWQPNSYNLTSLVTFVDLLSLLSLCSFS